MGLKVVEAPKKGKKKAQSKPKVQRTVQTSPIDFMIIPSDNRAREDAEVLIKAAEIKRDNRRYSAARKLIKGAVNI